MTATPEQPFDPGAHTIAEVQEYVTANPDQTAAVREAEAAGKGRSTLLSWLDEPWPEEESQPGDVGGVVTDEGGRPMVDEATGWPLVRENGEQP